MHTVMCVITTIQVGFSGFLAGRAGPGFHWQNPGQGSSAAIK